MKAFGTTVSVGGTDIGGLKEPNIDGGSVSEIDTTTHDGTGTKTYIGGLLDSGTLSLSGTYIPADAGQVALLAAQGTVVEFIRTLPDSSTETFDAVVGMVNISAPLDGEATFSCTCKISDAISRA